MTDRPIALTVIPENIPDELKALKIWSNMRYEWNGKRWGKIPYTPFTTDKARSNAPSTWRTFDEAYACYLERGDFFDGIFICLSADDPYTGGDFDHTEDQSRIPYTYAERSVGGNGSRFIGRGTIPSACKKPEGELYTAKRFLSITGHRLEGFPSEILSIQDDLDELWDELKGGTKEAREGKPGAGDRAALAASHSQEEWGEARRQQRLNISQLLGELNRKSVNNRTGRRNTMLAYILREDYTGFHNKWPHVGIVRGDGSIDQSQIRAVMANSIKGRGFPFPQFVALMSHFYGADCVKKWGTKQAVQEEFATLWDISRTPRTGEYKVRIEPVKRGKGGDHALLLERAYIALEDHKAGAQAFITQQQLADALGVHRRTAITLMQELKAAGRITYVAMRDNAGIVVSFGGVINEKNKSGNAEHSNGVNGNGKEETVSAPILSEGVINQNDEFAFTDAQTDEVPFDIGADFLEIELGKTDEGVINEKTESETLGIAEAQPNTAMQPDERENKNFPIDIYINSVSLSADTITPRNRVSLRDAVCEALDNLPKTQASEATGELKKWPVTVRRVIEFVQYEYSERGWQGKAITSAYQSVRKQRKNQEFEDLKSLKRDALEKKHAGVQKEIARYLKQAATDPNPDLKKWWAGMAAQKRGRLALLGWELKRRDDLDAARIATEGYSQGEQQEMLDLVEKERGKSSPTPPNAASVSLPTAEPGAGGIVERLKALKKQSEDTQFGGLTNAA